MGISFFIIVFHAYCIIFQTSFCIKSLRLVTFFLLTPKLNRLSTDLELDSIVTLQCSTPVATTFILTLSLIGDKNNPLRASTVKCTSLYLTLQNRVRERKTCLTHVYVRLALRGKSSVVLFIFYLPKIKSLSKQGSKSLIKFVYLHLGHVEPNIAHIFP